MNNPYDNPGENASGNWSLIKSIYDKRRVLITGHTGFKGSWLSLWLERLGAEVVGYALEPPSTPSLFELAGIGNTLADVRADVRDFDNLKRTIKEFQPEIAFHLAAQPIVRISYTEPKETLDTNIGGTINFLEALRTCASVRSVVVITSDKCYENRETDYCYEERDPLGGHDPYSASKASAEIVSSAYEKSFFTSAGVGLATARAGNVIGGGDWGVDRIIPDAVRAIDAGEPLGVRNPGAIRPWQHVLEPSYGYLLLGARLYEESGSESDASLHSQAPPLMAGKHSGAWNFGPSREDCRTVKELASLFFTKYGKGSYEDLSDRQKTEPHEANLLMLGCSKASEQLGWQPRWNFEEAVTRTAKWYRDQAAGKSARGMCLAEIDEYMRLADDEV
jgi:CDP-glucose 4,6-dehydratase